MKGPVVFLYLAIAIAAIGSSLLLVTWWQSHTLLSASDDAGALCTKATPGLSAEKVLAAARAAGGQVEPAQGQVIADFGRCSCFVTMTPDGTVASAMVGCKG